jgi:hypothetical protein
MLKMSNSNAVKTSDIAPAAGVSLATVGRVLHKRGYVSAEIRGKIERLLFKGLLHGNTTPMAELK